MQLVLLSQKKSIFFYIQQQFGLNFVPTKINCLIKRSVFFEIEKLILLKNFILNKTWYTEKKIKIW